MIGVKRSKITSIASVNSDFKLSSAFSFTEADNFGKMAVARAYERIPTGNANKVWA